MKRHRHISFNNVIFKETLRQQVLINVTKTLFGDITNNSSP